MKDISRTLESKGDTWLRKTRERNLKKILETQ